MLVIDGEPSTLRVLEGLRRAGVGRLDLVVSPGGLGRELNDALEHRWPLGRVLVVADSDPTRLEVGGLVVEVVAADEPVHVEPL